MNRGEDPLTTMTSHIRSDTHSHLRHSLVAVGGLHYYSATALVRQLGLNGARGMTIVERGS